MNDKIKYFAFILVLFFSACLKEELNIIPFTGFAPKSLNDGWVVSTPGNENMDSLKLANVYQSAHNDHNLWPLRSILVFRNNKLVAESYFRDPGDIHFQRPIWSCTKQVVGILTGLALKQGYIHSLNDPVSKYMPQEFQNHTDKASITIRQMITMKSGIDYSNDGSTGQTDKILRQIPDDIVEFILDLPMKDNPGNAFTYKDGDPQLISAMIQKVSGKPTDTWANEVLFSKIGLKNYDWYRYKDGITLGGFGILTTAREMGKIGQLILNKGMWNGNAIVDSTWLSEMLAPTVVIDNTYSFGYYWWIDHASTIRFMWGHGGQFVFIIPEKNMVVTVTSEPHTEGDHQNSAEEILVLVKEIIKAAN